MKKPVIVLALLSVLAFCNSNFSVGFKTDFLTGLKVSYRGLDVEESYLAVNQEKLKSNEVDWNAKVFLHLKEVWGFVEKEGKAYPGASMTVTGPAGEMVIDEKDLYAQFDQGGCRRRTRNIFRSRCLSGLRWKGEKPTSGGRGYGTKTAKAKSPPR